MLPSRVPRPKPELSVVDGLTEPDWSAQFTDELDQELARLQWRVIVGELRGSEKLANANERQIKRLVDSYVLYEIAMRHVAEEGAVFPRKGKKQPAYNPWFTVLKDANSMASAAEAELTITPRRRNNGGKVQRKKPSLIGGGYLKSVTK
jgi:P27 family predicted phage terminase small subunit